MTDSANTNTPIGSDAGNAEGGTISIKYLEPDKNCPVCLTKLVVTGTHATSKFGGRRLKGVGMTCPKCGLNVNSECVDLAHKPWPDRTSFIPFEFGV